MKRVTLITSLTIFLTSLVSAGPVQGLYQLTDGLREVIRILIQFIGNTIFEINAFDEYLFAKLLLFTLILLVVYTVISKNSIFGGVTGNKTIQWIISIAVSILAIRYLPDNFIQAILLQYGTLAVGITVFLPLIIYFFFVQQSGIGPFGRKVAWLVYLVGFFALWSIRRDDLGEANWIYWIAIAFVLISLLFDKRIHRYFGLSSARKIMRMTKEKQHRHWKRELLQLEEDYRNGVIEKQQYDIERPILEKRIRDSTP
jgi:hypothetical protein